MADIRSGMSVADFGCGTIGHYVFPAARMVGPGGKTYAVDILKAVLAGIESRRKLEGASNVEAVWGDLSDPEACRWPTARLMWGLSPAAAGVRTGLWLPVISLVVTSVIGLFAYLRVVVAMFQPDEAESPASPSIRGALLDASIFSVLTAAVFFIGINPGPLMAAIGRLMVLAQ